MTATVAVLTRIEPLKVSVAPDQSTTLTPVHLDTGADIVAMTSPEARALAAALLTAAAFEPEKSLRRPVDVDDQLRESDR